ncbi:twitching motility protein PilT [Nostocales cyanobacterium HT-58-2]|nr:twitching motility protein PilT [Nostocales cyanobacterium HT-58-2]
MSYLIDTNVLLRVVQKNSPMHSDARRTFVTLRKQSEKLCIIPQNLIEFWAVATRPLASNGLGLTTDEAEKATKKLKRILILFPDTPVIFTVWENLVTKYQVMGKQAHDTRLVAAMIAYQMTHLLTFNTADFK